MVKASTVDLSKDLLEPGWAGELGEDELAYIKDHLKASNRLRSAWGFPAGDRRLSEPAIKQVAMWGRYDDKAHNARLVKKARKPHESGAVSDFPATKKTEGGLGNGLGRKTAARGLF